MGLSVFLESADGDELFSANITHNLTRMASAAGIYEAVWRPDEHGLATAGQLAPILVAGLTALTASPDEFIKLNPENGWGSWEGFVPWLAKYLAACVTHPDALVRVCR